MRERWWAAEQRNSQGFCLGVSQTSAMNENCFIQLSLFAGAQNGNSPQRTVCSLEPAHVKAPAGCPGSLPSQHQGAALTGLSFMGWSSGQRGQEESVLEGDPGHDSKPISRETPMLVWRKDAGAWWDSGGWWPGHERGPRREQQAPVCIFESVPCPLCGPKPCSPVFQSLRWLLLTSERVHLTSHTGLWRSCVRLPAGLPHWAWKALDPIFLSKFRFFSKERKQQREIILCCVPSGTITAPCPTSRPSLASACGISPSLGPFSHE